MKAHILPLLALCIFIQLASPIGAAQSIQQDMKTIKQQVVQNFIAEHPVDAKKVASLLETLQSDGLWQGVDYTSERRTNWPIFFDHYGPTAVLTRALLSPDSPYHNDPHLEAATLSALRAWLKYDWQNPNWWYGRIGGPLILGPLLLALEDQLTAEELQKGVEILEAARIGMTGANRVWVATVTIYRGLLIEEPDVIRAGVRAVEDTFSIGKSEGIQYDWSFHQHGELLFSHGYGSPFLRLNAEAALLTTNTAFAMQAESVEKLINMTLDGNQWMVYGPAQDYGANGRANTRPGTNSAYLVPIINVLLRLPTDRTEELKALRAHLENPAEHPPLTGNRHFWASDYMTHKREGYFASARMHSTRTFNTDGTHNQEGLRNHFVADGCNYLFLRGDEYYDIFGAWDWRKIPGTTANQSRDMSSAPRRKGNTDFVGGASDGVYGLSAFDLERGAEMRGRKSWFFFDDEYVCLGAGITSSGPGTIFTTLNQCHLRGEVVVADTSGERIVPQETHNLSNPAAVHHDGVGYILLDGNSTLLRTTARTGSWSDSNRNSYVAEDESTLDIFLLGINHGRTPKNAGYAYIVAPGMDAHSMAGYAANPAVEVLSNTPGLQAVSHNKLGITQAVFYETGELSGAGGLIVSADAPCLVMIRNEGNALHLTVADPTQKLEQVCVALPGHYTGEGTRFDPAHGMTIITLALPSGGHAGRSVTRILHTH
ncbi:MAG: hypothetical protein EA353_14715 [Puniceicoccaceae bacterium]|nr:MAG: hypothetical protein EA353_14715 [Puniceicoccaceae bacterium]